MDESNGKVQVIVRIKPLIGEELNHKPILEIDKSNNYIDCINTTPSGKKLAIMQAKIQFKLYRQFEMCQTFFSNYLVDWVKFRIFTL